MDITGCSIGTQLRKLAEHPDSTLVAEAAVKHWHAIREALAPIIGVEGVAALYRRSLYLARADYPWLADDESGTALPAEPLDSLRAALSQRPGADAASAQIALLQTFNDLLASLIGSALTDRLLAPVCDTSSPGGDAKDNIP